MTTLQFIRTTAAIAIIGSLVGIVVALAALSSPDLMTAESSGAVQLLSALAFALVLAGVLGLWRSGAVGRQRLGVLGLALTFIGQVIALVIHIQYSDTLGLAAGLAIGVGMLLVAAAVIQAGRWQSWRRYMPLVCALSPILSAFLYPVGFESLGTDGVLQATGIILLLCWLLVNVALWIEAERTAAAPLQTVT